MVSSTVLHDHAGRLSPETLGQGERAHGLLRHAFVVLLLSTTVLERFGLNFGTYSLDAALPGMYGFLAVAAACRALKLSLVRLSLYGVCLGFAVASAALNGQRTSFMSLSLLGIMYLPFVFTFEPGAAMRVDAAGVMRIFLNVALPCALVGIVQFYLQFVVHGPWLFDFSSYIPPFLRGSSGYNTVIPVGTRFKSNGFFFREPSWFSLFIALALIGEAVSRKRVLPMFIYGFALLLTYSGTGLLALFIGMLFPLGRKTVERLVVVGCVGGLALWLLGDTLNLSFTLGRVDEFGSERSSAYIRYIAPLRLIGDTIDTDAWTPWLGHGPGTIMRTTQRYEFHDPTWAKLIYEYGILGFIAFVTLFLAALHRNDVSAQVRALLFFAWLIMGGHLLSPEVNFLTLALVGFVPTRAGALGEARAMP